MATLRREVEAHFLSIAKQPGSFASADDYTSISFRPKTSFARGGPAGTWVQAGTNQVASIALFGIILNADVTSYGTGAGAKSLDVSILFYPFGLVATQLSHTTSRLVPASFDSSPQATYCTRHANRCWHRHETSLPESSVEPPKHSKPPGRHSSHFKGYVAPHIVMLASPFALTYCGDPPPPPFATARSFRCRSYAPSQWPNLVICTTVNRRCERAYHSDGKSNF